MWYKDLLLEIRSFCKLFGLEVKSLNGLNINGNASEEDKAIIGEDGIVTINLNNLTPDEKMKFRSFIQSAHKQNAILIESTAEEKLEIIEESETYAAGTEVIKLLTGVIKASDLAALRMSMYLRFQHEKENQRLVSILKSQICEKFGDRGKNISNLCTAGYFETFILPLFKECRSGNGHTDDDFRRSFDVIIDESAFSIFVNSRMTKDDIKQRIGEQIAKNTKYGIKHLVVHGIGELNVRNISAAVTDMESAGQLNLSNLDKSKPNLIRVRCTY